MSAGVPQSDPPSLLRISIHASKSVASGFKDIKLAPPVKPVRGFRAVNEPSGVTFVENVRKQTVGPQNSCRNTSELSSVTDQNRDSAAFQTTSHKPASGSQFGTPVLPAAPLEAGQLRAARLAATSLPRRLPGCRRC